MDTAFGCPGAAILPMYDAMHGSGVEHLIVGHEEGPTHMTDRWARTTGGVGVAIGISGPAGTMERPLILAGGGVVAWTMRRSWRPTAARAPGSSIPRRSGHRWSGRRKEAGRTSHPVLVEIMIEREATRPSRIVTVAGVS